MTLRFILKPNRKAIKTNSTFLLGFLRREKLLSTETDGDPSQAAPFFNLVNRRSILGESFFNRRSILGQPATGGLSVVGQLSVNRS